MYIVKQCEEIPKALPSKQVVSGFEIKSMVALILTAIFVSLISMYLVSPKSPFSSFNDVETKSALHDDERDRYHYVIFFDAGSTGTRVHVFTFYNKTDKFKLESQMDLMAGDYFYTQPGLSSFASNPEQIPDSLMPLLREAQRIIPKHFWHSTPICLKATAGLRLLPEIKADNILETVRAFFAATHFKYDPECVSILDGTDEGIFAWQTVNFLLERNDLTHSDTVVTLDLGGGSTQITFIPNELNTLMLSPKSHFASAIEPRLGKPVTVYSKSYLGFGLMSARLGMLLSTNPSFDIDNLPEDATLYTPCFYPESSRNWVYGNNVYRVEGINSTFFGYHACYHQAKAFLSDNIFVPDEADSRIIYAMSYYFDRAADAGIIDRQMGGVVTVDDFVRAAKLVCSRLNEDELFLCLDLTYIAAFLKNGLGLNQHKEIHLIKKLQGMEASWVLGAAFQLLR